LRKRIVEIRGLNLTPTAADLLPHAAVHDDAGEIPWRKVVRKSRFNPGLASSSVRTCSVACAIHHAGVSVAGVPAQRRLGLQTLAALWQG